MSPKLLVFFLILGVLALSVQAGGKKHKSSESKSKESKSKESKSSGSKSSESKSSESKSSESKSDEDCKEPPRKCGPNEEWNDCCTACPATCDSPKPLPCMGKCKPGCQCKNGLLRNKWGKCVQPCDC